jgi:hypothetical protein
MRRRCAGEGLVLVPKRKPSEDINNTTGLGVCSRGSGRRGHDSEGRAE